MKQVLETYQTLGRKYLDNRLRLKSDLAIKMLLRNIKRNSIILDVGCGMGVPVDDLLVKAGHEVIGIDLSPAMIKEARQLVLEADYNVMDMRALKSGMYEVDAVVCLYAIFHIPRSEHKTMLETFASFLPKGGKLLISMGDRAFEGTHLMYGVKSYSSQWGCVENQRIIESAGFRINWENMATSGYERHQMILAERI